jgi:hypothetical protein
MKLLALSTDPVFTRPAAPSRLYSLVKPYLQDERDIPFAYLILKISATMLPLAVLLYVPQLHGLAWWLATAAYLF